MNKWYFISPLILQKIIWIPTRISLKYFGSLDIFGLENLKGIKNNAIFACNHSSELDPILIPASLPFWSCFSPIFYTSRESKFYVNSGWRKHFYGGWFFKIWGAYPVRVGLRDYGKSLAHHIRIVNAGGSLCIFPEGKTTSDGSIQSAKGGVTYLSHITGIPIIPVRIDGDFNLSWKEFIHRRRRLIVSFGEPICVNRDCNTELSIDELKSHANFVMDKIRIMGFKN